MKQLIARVLRHKKVLFAATVVLFIALGLFLRVYQIGENPPGTYWDETAILMDARSIIETGRDVHGNNWLQALYPSYGDYKLPVFIWFVSPFVAIFGSQPIAVRFPSLVIGLLTIAIGALIAGELSKHWRKKQRVWFQIGTVFVLSVSYWAIHFSRVGFEAVLAQLLIGIAVWALLRAREKPWFWLLAGGVGAVSIFTYYSARFVWPVLWLFFVLPLVPKLKLLRHKKHLSVRLQIASAAVSIVVFFFAFSIMTGSPLYSASEQFRLSSPSIMSIEPFVKQANEAQSVEGDTPAGKLFLNRRVYQVRALLNQLSANASLNTLFVSGDANPRHGSGYLGLFPLILLPVFLVGVLSLLKHHRFNFALLIAWWAVALLPASVALEVPHALRSLNALLPLSLIMGYGLSTLWLYRHKLQPLLLIGFFGILGFELLQFSQYYFEVYPQVTTKEWQAGYRELALHLWANRDTVPALWANTGDDRFFLWFLAYTDISPATMQALPWENYTLISVDDISFRSFEYTLESWPKTPFALAGRRSMILDNLAIIKKSPSVVVPISDSRGGEEFVVAYFGVDANDIKYAE